jgi:hypothetical protein
MDPEEPVPGLVHGGLLRELDEGTVDALVDVAGPESDSPLLQVEIRHLGGALGRPAEGGGALSHLDAAYSFSGVGMPMGPGAAEAIRTRQDQIYDALGEWRADSRYFNFTERPAPYEELFSGEVAERLSRVKREWDPEDAIRANHAVPVAA